MSWINELQDELTIQKINTKNISIQFLSILLIGTVIRYLNNCNFQMLNNLIFELRMSNINYKYLLNSHVKPPGADVFNNLLKKRIFYFCLGLL